MSLSTRPFRAQHILPHVALIAGMCVWSTSYPALRVALSGLTPVETMAARLSVGTLVFAPFLPGLWRALRRHGHVGGLLFMGFAEPCCYFLFETYGLRLTTSSQAGMVVSLLPLITAAVAWLLLKERLSRRAWLGFVLAVAGVVWLTVLSSPSEEALDPPLGNLLEGLAVVCAALYTVMARRYSTQYNPIQITAVQSCIGMVFFSALLLVWPHKPAPIDLGFSLPAWAPWASVVYLGACVTVVGYGLYNFGVNRLSAGEAAAYTNLIPVITLFLGVTLMHETFLPVQYLAAAVIIAGVVISQWRPRAPQKQTPSRP